MNICVVIPVYNHWQVLESIIESLARFNLTCFLVDDGSESICADVVSGLGRKFDWVYCDRLAENTGKGAAVIRGLELASDQGFTHAIQIDADGQHDLDDVEVFVNQARKRPGDLVLGVARYDSSVPRSRFYGRFITHFWVWVNTLSLKVKDSMCGFRVYPVASTLAVHRRSPVGLRMQFDIEIVVKMVWAGVSVSSLPTLVTYPKDGISHFDVWRDNVRISSMHSRLFLGMLIRFPLILWHRLRPATWLENAGDGHE